MTRYMILFPSPAMQVTEEELPAVSDAARAVVREAKAAGVLVFAGGQDESVAPVLVAGDGTVTEGTYPQTKEFSGGLTIIDVPTLDEAMGWAAKIAVACRCSQEVRPFVFDPDSY
ncbi:YciI family protein [Leifsonia sp. 2MCAF36]|uniref:YciI family protein n=1 Tax=Leifsonia sp. 2MCAF36 TaxID=3232988 RepID=UPI003F9A7EB7